MLLINVLVLLLRLQLAFCARYNVIGSQDQEQYIRLKSQYDLAPGVVLKLPIDVPQEYITLFGTLPPRLVSITAQNKNGVYGTGDVILIDLQFTIPVNVAGIPSLTLNTGCHDSSCQIAEIQSFVCAADKGMFGLRLYDQFIMNIDVNTTSLQFQYLLEQLNGLNNVSVVFNNHNDTVYSHGNRICTSVGKNVTITFNNVTFPQYNGNVPNLEFSTLNQFADIRSGLDIGIPVSAAEGFLGGINPGYRAFIVSNELRSGFQKADATAYYSHGSGTNTITFSYTVQSGDFTSQLEVKSINFVGGYIFGNITGANVSTAVPNFGAGPRYMSISPSSLGFNKNITITSASPQILSVTSPNSNGVYTQGDIVIIQVIFNLPVKVFLPNLIGLQLFTGAFDRTVSFIGLTDDFFTMEFQYTVQQGDFTTALDTVSSSSLTLNGGAIYRRTSTNETAANLTLPTPGSASSLSGQKSIVINTLSSQIVSINIISKKGMSTTGDNIDFDVLYENAVHVIGSPRLLIANTPKQLNAVIRNAPYLSNYSFTRAYPSNDAQIILSFQLNWALKASDKLTVHLPSLSSKSLTNLEDLSISGSSGAFVSAAIWDKTQNLLTLTFNATILSFSKIELIVAGKSGLFLPSSGIIPKETQFSFDVISSSVLPIYTKDYSFSNVAAVGFESVSISISPAAISTPLQIAFSFSVPETLEVNDTIALKFKGFNASFHNLRGAVTSDLPYFRFDWFANESLFLITTTMPTSKLSFVVFPSRFVTFSATSSGVAFDGVTVTASMANNGHLNSLIVTNSTKICGTTSTPQQSNSVNYLQKSPSSASAVQFSWTIGPTALAAGDTITFTLPYYNSSLGLAARTIASAFVSGSQSYLFAVYISGPDVTFQAIDLISALEPVTLLLSEQAGLVVPPTGVRPSIDYFTILISSKNCEMTTPLKVYFSPSEGIISVSSPTFQVIPKGSLKLGSRVALSIQFGVSNSFYKNDEFFVTIPNFSRNILIDPRNNSIFSNANLTSRFNRLEERLEFTFQSAFSSSHKTLSVLVEYSESFAIPTTSMSNNGFLLSIYSTLFGTLSQHPMSGPCLGFCTGSVSYSTPFRSEYLSLVFNLSYSQHIHLQTANLTFLLNQFTFGSKVTASISIFSNASTPSLLTTKNLLVTENSKNLLVKAAVTIPPFYYFIVTLNGLYYSNSNITVSPEVLLHDSSIGGTPTLKLASQYVLENVVFSKAELSFGYSLDISTSMIQLTFQLVENLFLRSGDIVKVHLPHFRLGASIVSFTSSDVGFNSSKWQSTSSTLLLHVNQLVNSTEEIYVNVYGFIFPDFFSRNYSNCSYSIGINENNVIAVTNPLPFTTVAEFVAVKNYSVAFTLLDSSMNIKDLSTISLSFTLVGGIESGDSLIIKIPYVFQINDADPSEMTIFLSVSGNDEEAVWMASNSSLKVVLNHGIPAGDVSIKINGSSSFLQLSAAGVPSDTYSSLLAYKKGTNNQLVAFAESLMPCIGICSASLTLAERKAGYATLYNVSVVLGFSNFSFGDSILFQLTGFTKSQPLTQNLSVMSFGLNSSQIYITWDETLSTLMITPSSNSTWNSPVLEFQIPQNFGLKCPSVGIRDGVQYVVNWTKADSGETYGNVILSISPVGYAFQSAVSISPIRPNAVATLQFSWTFSDALVRGDQIYVYFNKYSVPNGTFIILNCSISSNELSVTGVSGSEIHQTNPDGSTHVTSTQGYLVVKLNTGIPAGYELSFQLLPASGPYSLGIQLPAAGVYRNTVPRFAVASKTSPIAAGLFISSTSVGSLSPSNLDIEALANNTVNLFTNFFVNCPIFANDFIVIMIPNLVLVNSHHKSNINITHVNSSSISSSGGFEVKWLRKPNVLEVKVAPGAYVLSGSLQLVITISNVARTTAVVYPNDPSYQYSLHSSSCPIHNSSFDSSVASYLKSSIISFNNNSISGKETSLELSFTPVSDLLRNDTIVLAFPHFRLELNHSFTGYNGNNMTHTFRLSRKSSCLQSSATAIYSRNTSSLVIEATVQYNCEPLSTISFLLTPDLAAGILTSPNEVAEFGSGISIHLKRWQNNTAQTVFHGFIQTVQPVETFSHSQIVVGNPTPSSETDLTISWSLTQAVLVGDYVSVTLTNFNRNSSKNAVSISGSAARYFSAIWEESSSTLKFTALSAIQASLLCTAYIPDTNKFSAPSSGISTSSSEYTISLIRKNSIIVSEIIAEVSVVPVLLESSISFISSDYSKVYFYGGINNTLQLFPGHELTELDIGAQIVIDDVFYDIENVTGELLTLSSSYIGPRVLLGSPSVPIYTPPFRYAYYLRGSNTANLIFRYKVRRGDISSGLAIFNPAGTKFNTTHLSLEFNGGNLLRLSQAPAIVVSTLIPSYAVDYTRQVNSDTPYIRELKTSSIANAYSVGQAIDFQLQFNYSVAVGNESYTHLELLLDIKPFGRVTAYYASGSGTDTIVFVYNVSSIDYDTGLGNSIDSTNDPVYSYVPLRVITTYHYTYLRRNATEPTIDVAVDFPSNTIVNIPSGLQILGIAPKVVSISASNNSRNDNYTAGDIIYIYVEYSAPVTVVGLTSHTVPYIWLDLGSYNGNLPAKYSSMYNSKTLKFSYEITTSDKISNGLYLLCTCTDYFKRTFISMNGSTLYSHKSNTSASLLLANSSDPSELLLNSDAVIDNSVPYVLFLSNNISSSSVPLSPGDMILVSVTFSNPVTVQGIVKLILKGDNTECPTYFYSGNNSNTLNFLYMASFQSGVSILDCTNASSLNTVNGKILRLSDNPVILADTKLPIPGTQESLGLFSPTIIDTSMRKIVAASIVNNEGLSPFLSTSSVSLNLFGNLSQLLHLSSAYSVILDSSTTVNQTDLLIESDFDESVIVQLSQWGSGNDAYNRLTLLDSFSNRFRYLPIRSELLTLTSASAYNYWWSSYNVQSQIEIQIYFDRDVVQQNALLTLNTGNQLNKAVSSPYSHVYYLQVEVQADNTIEQFYRLAYGGYQTACISLRASAKGPFSIQEALENVPAIRKLLPDVITLDASSTAFTYQITFTYLPIARLQVLSPSQISQSCSNSIEINQITISQDLSNIIFQYSIRNSGSLILTSKNDIKAGKYSFHFGSSNGIGISPQGLPAGGAQLSRITASGEVIALTSIDKASRIPAVVRSSLSFDGIAPNTSTGVAISLCTSGAFGTGDVIEVTLPGFNTTFPAANDTILSSSTLHWLPHSNMIRFVFLENSECLTEVIPDDFGFILPNRAIFQNSPQFLFTVNSKALGIIQGYPFSEVAPIGIADFKIEFFNPTIDEATDIMIQFTIASKFEYSPGDTYIILNIPQFRTLKSKSNVLEIAPGPFADSFSVHWSNLTDYFLIRPTVYITAGTYFFKISSSKPSKSIVVPEAGLYNNAPPTFSFHSKYWSVEEQAVASFPFLYGYSKNSELNFLFSENSTYSISAVDFRATLSRQVSGPAVLTLHLPCITNKFGDYTFLNTTVGEEAIAWNEEYKTLTVFNQVGWSADLALHLSLNLSATAFYINSLGIEDGASTNMKFSVNGTNGYLAPIAISSVQRIPRIQYSSLTFGTTQPDLFTPAVFSVHVEMSLNFKPTIGDTFTFNLYGIPPIAAGLQENNTCFAITSNSSSDSLNFTSITVLLTNATSNLAFPCHYQKQLQMTFSEQIGNNSVRSVIQYASSQFYLSWNSSIFTTGEVLFSSVPVVGLTYSRLDILNPLAGAVSELTFKVITATRLEKGDSIVLTLPFFTFNVSNTNLQDNYANTWAVHINSSYGFVSLQASSSLQPGAFEFIFTKQLLPKLPVIGIPSGTNLYTITIARGSTRLNPQSIRYITPVGYVTDISFRPTQTFSYIRNSAGVVSGAASSVHFTVEINTNSVLNNGDVIKIEMPQYKFTKNSELTVPAAYQSQIEVAIISPSTMKITLRRTMQTTALFFETIPSELVQIVRKNCVPTNCSMRISIDSHSCPVKQQSFHAKEIFTSSETTVKFFHWSAVPTLYPSYSPSVQVNGSSSPTSAIPSASPITPSAVPSVEPAAYSSLVPTNIFDEQYFVIQISFSLQRILPLGSIFEIRIPQLIGNGTVDITVLEDSSAQPFWVVQWIDSNAILACTVLQNLSPGLYTVSIGSSTLRLNAEIIYAYNPAITYSIVYDNFTYEEGVFPKSYSSGLRNSSLSFSNPVAGGATAIKVSVSADTQFNVGDTVIVRLPNFVKNNLSLPILLTADSITLNSLQYSWDSVNHQLTFTFSQSIQSAVFSVPLVNEFIIPLAGANLFMNTPTINLVTFDGKFFKPTTFEYLTPVASVIMANISFLNPIAGTESPLNFVLYSNYPVYLQEYDVLRFNLPSFWSLNYTLTIDANKTRAWWVQCQESLQIQMLHSQEFTEFQFTISGVRIPLHGVSSDIANLISFSSNSTASGVISILNGNMNIQTFGELSNSVLTFNPLKLQHFLAMGIQLTYSTTILEGYLINAHIPGVVFQKSNPSVTLVTGVDGQAATAHARFNGTWDHVGHNLKFTLPITIPANNYIHLTLDNSVKLPSTGILSLDAHEAVTYSILQPNGALIGLSPVLAVSKVGLVDGLVKYNIPNLSGLISLQFELQFSGPLQVGDNFTITSPVVSSSSPFLVNLTLSGDQVDENFMPHLSATFEETSKTFSFVVTSPIVSRLFTIFVGIENNLFVNESISFNQNFTHYFSGSVASIGAIGLQPIAHYPTDLFDLLPVALQVTNCKPNVGCNIGLEFTLRDNLPSGDMIVLTHESLTKYNSISLLNFSSSSHSEFQASWRPADNTDNLQLVKGEISTFKGGFVRARADYVRADANTTFPLGISLTDGAIASNIPRVIQVYAVYPFNDLVCNDSLDIFLVYDRPVLVQFPVNLKLLLNTEEFANYFSGNLTSTLQFRYYSINPLPTNDLTPLGPGALEFFTESTLVVDAARPNVAANSSIPGPYGRILRSSMGYQTLLVPACSVTASVIEVVSYSQPFVTYTAGDVLDVKVVFSRPITVLGEPILQLTGNTDSNIIYDAKFVNISSIQWITIASEGWFALSYLGSQTNCIFWNDSSALLLELSSINSLETSLPLSIESFSFPFGFKYKIVFSGVAPFMLEFRTLSCDYETVARVSIDSSLWNAAIFRYTVKAGDAQSLVNYVSSQSLSVNNSLIVLSNGGLQLSSVNTTLPDPSEPTALAATSGVRFFAETPVVSSIISNFSHRHANSGDLIVLEVNYSAPVFIPDYVRVYLDLQLVNHARYGLEYVTNNIVRTLALSSYSGRILSFEYLVQVGDSSRTIYGSYLTTTAANSLRVVGGSIYLNSSQPSVIASLKLPSNHSFHSIASNHIIVNATGPPVILNVSSTHVGGIVHAGEEIIIDIAFSSNVSVVASSARAPFIPFSIPTGAKLSYLTGSETSTLSFVYTVGEGDAANHTLSFYFFLKGGHLLDSYGNKFSNYSNSASREFKIPNIVVDTIPPVVLYVNTTNPDGMYYPGSKVIVYVVFDKPVVIIGSSLPSLQLLIHYPDDGNSIASYMSGNATNILYFEWTIPSPDAFFAVQLPVKLDYGGVSALYSHLNGCSIREISANPTTEANVLLPHFDKSFLTFHREVYISFQLAIVSRVYSVSPNGTYSAGDEIVLAVEFTERVMVFIPPTLKLFTGAFNRSAVYIGGNNSNTLTFKYTVVFGDSAKKLDYIDTRYSPYNTLNQQRTMALSTDVLITEPFLSGTQAAIFEYPTNVDGGVFMSSETLRIPCFMDLPLPGGLGSLSSTSSIVIDANPPYIKKVTVNLPDGTYGDNFVIPVIVQFSAVVLIGGCPRILFQVNGVDKYAKYVSGSGSPNLLFQYPVAFTDSFVDFDYFDRYSFKNMGCNITQDESTELLKPVIYVLRSSDHPQVYANLTMPWVKYVESVIAPVSITGGGKHINLAGSQAYPRVIWTTAKNGSLFSLGDVINVYVGFSSPVSFPLTAYINLTDSTSKQKNIYATQQVNETTIRFTSAVGDSDYLQFISYFDSFALRTVSSCSIIDKDTNACAAQNLPNPNSTKSNSLDSLTPKELSFVSIVESFVESVEFVFTENSQYFTTGSAATIRVTFSTDVTITGRPLLNLFLDENRFPVIFEQQISNTTILFSASIDSSNYQGVLACTAYSTIDLNGGSIFKSANFVPILPVNTSLSHVCCPNYCNNPRTVIVRDTPVVLRVYSNQLGVFSASEAIILLVQMSTNITVIGSPTLALDLFGHPSATFVSYVGDTIQFSYVVQSTDFTSSLDYVSINSLQVSNGPYDGIYLASQYANITANLTLPDRGANGSLGREASITINNGRPNIVSTFSVPTQSTSGDAVHIVVRYSEPMRLTDSSGRPVMDSSLYPSLLSLRVSIVPAVTSAVTLSRLAYLFEVQGTDVTFIYDVTSLDPTGSIYFSSSFPLQFNNSNLKSIKTGTEGPKKFLDAFVSNSLFSIDNNIPKVVRVFSPNVTTSYPFGVGDVIDIYVEMSLGVVVFEIPTLLLTLNNRIGAFAEYIAPNASTLKTESVTNLHFQYTVLEGDSATPLEYVSSSALTGYLLRYSSSNPSIVAILTLPQVFSLGSLGYCCNVQIDSSKPYIQSLVPLKRVGIYGENETIYILSRFNKPVIVYGVPTLLLNVGKGVGHATYKSSISEYDIIIDIRDTDVIFEYIVQRYDNVLSLHHTDSNALQLTNGSKILHKTNSPTLPADISLLDPTDTTVIDGQVSRQWKFRYPYSVEVLLRDFYHTKPSSLTVSIEHVGYSSTLFSGCCSGKTFGTSYPRSRTGTNATMVNIDAGIGSDYMFSDTMAVNIATKGSVTQSSTKVSGTKAIDNNVDPLIGDNSVSETSEENDAWWQILLPSNSVVQSIVIWAREPQEWIPPVVSYTVKGLATYPQGFYRLSFSGIDSSNSTHAPLVTGLISMTADSVAVQTAIESLPGIGNVEVTKSTLPLCASDFTGCGVGYEHGKGYVFSLQFSSLRVALPTVKIVDIQFIGQQTSAENITKYDLPKNVQPYQIVTHVDTVRQGFYIQVSAITQYGKGVPIPASAAASSAAAGSNEWLTPFWVFLFDKLPPTSINESVAQSIWFQRYESIDKLLNIVLKKPYNASYIKIQREGYGFLSLAEVQVFETRLNTLDSYSLGSPVAPSYLMNNYQPSDPLGLTFQNVPFDGRWLLQITQDGSLEKDMLGFSGSYGTISEVVLVITDLAGIVHSYYQDIKAEVQSLPKYGQLLYTVPETASPYGDWREAFEVGISGELTAKAGLERSLGYCYGDQASYCANTFGVGPLLNIRVLGDTPEIYDFRNERVVVYQPALGYLGPDYFTYIIYDGINLQTHSSSVPNVLGSVNEVTIHVRKCRRFQTELYFGAQMEMHPLCVCAQTEFSLVNSTSRCDVARTSVCTTANLLSSSGGFYNFNNQSDKFLSMCLSCFDPARGLRSGDCVTQTIRAVSLVTSRGLCSSSPPMDCSGESITTAGREKTNYLTLQPPTLYGAFSKLKNSFGAYGWYNTPSLT